MFRIKSVAPLGCAAFLFGCAAANVTPVRMSQPGDENLSCEALHQEIAKNNAAAADFIKRDKRVEDGNVAKGVGSAVGGVIPGVGLLIMAQTDLSNKEQIQGRALIDRDEHLAFLSKQKNCTD